MTLNVPARMDFVNITSDVEKVVAESKVSEGLCLVNAMHITASVFINDDEPGLHEDYKRWLEDLAPFDATSSMPRPCPRRCPRRDRYQPSTTCQTCRSSNRPAYRRTCWC